jgi:phosphoenolpyruvate phosphomutase
MTRALKLRQLLYSKETSVLMEAHNGLSAKLVAEAGFPAIWGSGLSISAALGVRDSNEASWTQVLEVLEFMNDAGDLPILMDGDTGYGNFNNTRRLIRKLEQRGIAGVCLEDKLFPKTNSFIGGEKQVLAEIDEFCGKLRAAKDTQRDSDFVVIARTEAFIAGWGLQEALLRATAYAESGADLILVHSKRKDSGDIMSFVEQWSGDTPLIIVPTKYPSEPIQSFVDVGITNFIFANHSLRTVITSLQENLKTLHDSLDLMSLEDRIVSVKEVFRLQDTAELSDAEEQYLPTPVEGMRALVLAATQGDFGELVEDKPKCMLRLRGKPILTWHAEALNRQGIKEIGVVRGYRPEAMALAGFKYFDNEEYEETGELYSLFKARDFLEGNLIIAYGDIVYDNFILQGLLSDQAPFTIAVDAAHRLRGREGRTPDLVSTSGVQQPTTEQEACTLERVGTDVPPEQASGEWVGLLALRGEGTRLVRELLGRLAEEESELLRHGGLVDLLNRLVADGQEVKVVHTYGHWRDLDDKADLLEADQVS